MDLGRRDRKKQATRLALEAAALRLFAERGYDRTTVAEIAEAAEVTERTFFRHFAAKEDVILGDATALLGRVTAVLAGRPAAEPPLAAVLATLRTLAGATSGGEQPALPVFAAERRALVESSPALSARVLRTYAAWETALADGVRARLGPTTGPETWQRDLYAAVTARCAMAALRSALRLQRERPDGPPLGELLTAAFDVLGTGCVPPAQLNSAAQA